MPLTFTEILKKAWQESADKEILHLLFPKIEDQHINYKQLIERSAAYANFLKQNNVLPGEVVILILQHSEDLIYAFFGAILHGAVPSIMPFLTEKLLPDRYRDSLKSLISITKPSAIITYPEFESEVQKAVTQGDSIKAVLVSSSVDLDQPADIESLSGLDRNAEDIVLLQHSSGTTGLQKGVALSHLAVWNQIESYSKAIALNENDVIVSWLPLYHDMGLIAGFIMPILYGVPLVLMSPFDWVRAPYRLMQAVSDYKGTLSWLPNFAYNFCAQKIRDRHLENVDLSSWRAVINCSEPMRADSHQIFLEKFSPYGFKSSALATCYAMAENVFAVTQDGIHKSITIDVVNRNDLQTKLIATPDSDGDGARKMVSAGSTISGTEVKIVTTEGQELPERHVGEIAVHSNCMLTEYYHRPDATAEVMKDGWYLTGDYGYVANNEIYITGRKKDLIIVGGKNVYPQDIETLAMEVNGVHPGRAAAFGVLNRRSGTEDIVIAAEVDTEDPEELKRIKMEIREIVNKGSDIVARDVHLVGKNWLVKTSSGKTARSANRDKYLKEIGE